MAIYGNSERFVIKVVFCYDHEGNLYEVRAGLCRELHADDLLVTANSSMADPDSVLLGCFGYERHESQQNQHQGWRKE